MGQQLFVHCLNMHSIKHFPKNLTFFQKCWICCSAACISEQKLLPSYGPVLVCEIQLLLFDIISTMERPGSVNPTPYQLTRHDCFVLILEHLFPSSALRTWKASPLSEIATHTHWRLVVTSIWQILLSNIWTPSPSSEIGTHTHWAVSGNFLYWLIILS